MKKLYTSLLALLLPFTFQLSTLFAQNDTIYFMKDGLIVNKQSIKMADLDSAIFYQPTIPEPTSGTFTDDRDNKVYKWVKIGNQVWMAENLNHIPVSGNRWCYDDNSTNCNIYGRLYDWASAMNGMSSRSGNPSGVQGVCPTGWHLPSDAEWSELIDFLGGTSVAGVKLKATSGWYAGGDGYDNYGFTAIAGGTRNNIGLFNAIESHGNWWSATQWSENSNFAWRFTIYSYDSHVHRQYDTKDSGFSVRCVRD